MGYQAQQAALARSQPAGLAKTKIKTEAPIRQAAAADRW
jgi:hypothetical protein